MVFRYLLWTHFELKQKTKVYYCFIVHSDFFSFWLFFFVFPYYVGIFLIFSTTHQNFVYLLFLPSIIHSFIFYRRLNTKNLTTNSLHWLTLPTLWWVWAIIYINFYWPIIHWHWFKTKPNSCIIRKKTWICICVCACIYIVM